MYITISYLHAVDNTVYIYCMLPTATVDNFFLYRVHTEYQLRGPVLCGWVQAAAPCQRRFTLHSTNRASARLNIKMGGAHDVSLTLTFDLIKLLVLCKCSTIEKWIAVAQFSAYSYSQGQASTPNEE